MIKYSGNTINDWYCGASNLIKVYRNGAVIYQYIGVNSPSGQTPCFAVVDNIAQYQDRTYEDVFNNADSSWYKLNNLNNYEKYGVYGSGKTITYYDGKLAIDEVSTSRLPTGYTEVEYIENTGTSYINTNLQLCSATTNTFTVEAKLTPNLMDAQTYQNIFACMSEAGEPYQGFTYRYQFSTISPTFIPSEDGSFTEVDNQDGTTSVTATSLNGLTYSHDYPLTICCGLDANRDPFRFTATKIYTFKVTLNNQLVADYVPAMRNSDNEYGLYDLITNTFYTSPNGNNFVGGSEVTPTTATCEFIYSGDSWVNLGEVSGSSRVPASYTEIEYLENTYMAYIDTGFKPNQDTRIKVNMQLVTANQYGRYITAGEAWDSPKTIAFDYENTTLHVKYANVLGWETYNVTQDYDPHEYDYNKNEFYMDDNLIGSHTYETFQCDYNLAIFGFLSAGTQTSSPDEQFLGKMYSCEVYDNGTKVIELVPVKRNSDDEYGAYDIIGDDFYPSANPNDSFSGGSEVTGQTVYPQYYTEMQNPPDNVVFTSMTQAESYECPWVGMHATIDGDIYVFNANYEWELQVPPTPSFKWLATYDGGTTSSAECDSTSAITYSEINLTNLTSVEVGQCVTEIGDDAFDSCSSLTSVTIPNSVESIGEWAFSECASLTSVAIGNNVQTIGVQAFQECTSLTSVDIPNSVESIGAGAFYNCVGVTSVTIGNSVTEIGNQAFDSCSSLTSITVEAVTPPALAYAPFRDTNDCPIYVPSGSLTAYQSAWLDYSSRIQAIQS